LAELGRIDEALARAARVAAACEASGDVHTLSEVHSVEATCQLARGHPAGLSVSADWLVQAAEDSGAADIIVMTLATAASIIVSEDPERAVALLVKLERVPGVRETPYSPRRLPEMVRTALVARSPHVGAALIDRIPNRYPLDEHASCAARASLAEHTGELEAAEDLFTEAASRWHEFGNVPERAYALFGKGRCLRTLARTGAEAPLLEARELFASMGFEPALTDVDEFLRHPASAPAS
jgi:hypothetical protein